VREVLKQPPYLPLPVEEQIAVLLAVTNGLFDELPLTEIRQAETAVRDRLRQAVPQVCDRIRANEVLSESDRHTLLDEARRALQSL
jgi:F-type H+-transporting ATPase subunit alpha